MNDWADEKAREFLNERWPSCSVDSASLAALLRDVAGEGSIGLGVAMGRAEAQAENERLAEEASQERITFHTERDGRIRAEAKLAEAQVKRDEARGLWLSCAAREAKLREAILEAEADIKALGFEAHPAVLMRLDRLVRAAAALAASPEPPEEKP